MIKAAALYRTQTGTAGRVHFYIRCSHVDSTESGLGLEAQRSECERVFRKLKAENPAVEMGRVFVDRTTSAYRNEKRDFSNRAEGAKLLREVRPGDRVVVAYFHRAFRRVSTGLRQVEDWEKQGVTLHIANPEVDCSTELGRFCLTFMAMGAEMESQARSETTKAALAARRLRVGSAPFGCRITKTKGQPRPTIDRRELAFIRLLRYLHDVRKWSWDTITMRLNTAHRKRLYDKNLRRRIPKGGRTRGQLYSRASLHRAYCTAHEWWPHLYPPPKAKVRPPAGKVLIDGV